MIGFVMQSSACNAVHRLEQRLARWLLLARDRIESDQFPMTQEFLAMMLGASRPTVTVVAGTLQKAGLIKYHRGQITIVDGEALENASCECYRTATALRASGHQATICGTPRRTIRRVAIVARNRRSRRRLHSNPYARRRCPGSIPAPMSRTMAVTGTMMADEEGASSAAASTRACVHGSMIADAYWASR